MTLEGKLEATKNKEKQVKIDVVNNNNERGKNDEDKKKENNKNRCNKSVRHCKRNEKTIKKARVKCQFPELKDKAFDCAGFKQAEECKKAKEALESWLTSHCKNGTNIWQTLEK